MLGATYARITHSSGVHLIANLESLLQGCNLLFALALTHLSYGKEQIPRLAGVKHRGLDAEQIGHHKDSLTTIWREIVHLTSE